MNASQIHLALNHVPLFFSLIGGLVLIYGFLNKNDSIKILSLYFLIAGALLTIPVYLTGEGAEEIVEKLPGVSENMIHEHEEMAKTGLIVIIITGIAALGTFVLRKRESLLKPGLILCILLSLLSFGIMAKTAHLGGQIRHTELRSSAISGDESKTETEEEDDD